ncbi:hypothetical protein NK8_04470 [Caballeronia sp. NK8]|nr:hypothetical protein NK8_04470 [Caballeronia sp. NK8]
MVGLKGHWGSGKTYLWKAAEQALHSSAPMAEVSRGEVAQKAFDSPPRVPALYCSLFGLGSIEEIRSKLLTSHLRTAAPRAAVVHEQWGKLKDKLGLLWNAGGGIGKAAGGAVDLVTSAASERYMDIVLQDRLVVLDDLERRSMSLSIIEILGFIESLKAENCQVLVIFNEEKIPDEESRKALASFREKVFDVEIRLATEPVEVFCIAAKAYNGSDLEPFSLREDFLEARITNIRIAKRAIDIFADVDRIAAAVGDGNDWWTVRPIYARAVATATNLFYEGEADGPALKELLQAMRAEHPAVSDARVLRYFPNAEYEFVEAVAQHLETGALPEAAYRNAIMLAVSRVGRRIADETVRAWIRSCSDPTTKTYDLTLEITKIHLQIPLLSPEVLSDFVCAARTVTDKQNVLEALAMARPFVELPPGVDAAAKGECDERQLWCAIGAFLKVDTWHEDNDTRSPFDPLWVFYVSDNLTQYEILVIFMTASVDAYFHLLMAPSEGEPNFPTMLVFLKKWADERVGAGATNLGRALVRVRALGTRRAQLIEEYLSASDAREVIASITDGQLGAAQSLDEGSQRGPSAELRSP